MATNLYPPLRYAPKNPAEPYRQQVRQTSLSCD
jgi:hypothetical protein